MTASLPPPLATRWKRSVARTVRRAIAAEPVYSSLRRIARRPRDVAVLMYHTIGADDQRFDAWTVLRQRDFVEQLRELRRHHDLVTLDDALDPGARSARPRAVLTFDDGHASLHSHLLPVVERERVPVTIYVATRHVETGQPYWFDSLMAALQRAAPTAVDLRAHGLGTFVVGLTDEVDQWLAISRVLEALKTLAPAERDGAVSQLLDRLGPGDAGRIEPNPLRPLSVDELKDLAASPWVTLGSHTHGHELLDQLPLDEAVASIEQSRARLCDWTGRDVRHFAYPNGNHTPALVAAVESLGFASAVTTRPGLWPGGQDRFAIPRVSVGRYDGLERFRLALLGRGAFGLVQ